MLSHPDRGPVQPHWYQRRRRGSKSEAHNIISGNGYRGVLIQSGGSDHNVIAGNFVGTDVTGTLALGNADTGISITNGLGNIIGGSSAADRNVSSGNAYGVGIRSSAAGTLVQGNFIGADLTGTAALGNVYDGVLSDSEALLNVIGTDGDGINDVSEGNLISGNGRDGIQIVGSAGQFTIAGNFIGTDVAGTAALGNMGDGVLITGGSANNVIGTNGDGVADTVERNVISGNGLHGVEIVNAGSDANMVAGNYIGTDITGMANRGNTYDGVVVSARSARQSYRHQRRRSR